MTKSYSPGLLAVFERRQSALLARSRVFPHVNTGYWPLDVLAVVILVFVGVCLLLSKSPADVVRAQLRIDPMSSPQPQRPPQSRQHRSLRAWWLTT